MSFLGDMKVLNFDFGLSPQEIIDAYPNIDFLRDMLSQLDHLSLDDIKILEKEFDDFIDYYHDKTRTIPYGKAFVNHDLERIMQRKHELEMASDTLKHDYYTQFVRCSEEQKVECGDYTYALYNVEKHPFCDFDSLTNLLDQKCLSEQPSEEEFLKWLHENCCSDWGRMDEEGETFYDDYLTVQEVRENNFEALLELPYPRKIIMFSIE